MNARYVSSFLVVLPAPYRLVLVARVKAPRVPNLTTGRFGNLAQSGRTRASIIRATAGDGDGSPAINLPRQ